MLRFCLLILLFMPLPAMAAPKIVATIAPLAGIAAAVTEGVSEPGLLIKNNASPHTYQLKPSDAALLAEANVILWVGAGMETFLADKWPAIAPTAKLIGVMDEDAGMIHLPVREGDNWAYEDSDHHNHEHDHGKDDPHAWLNPLNAITMAKRLAEVLAVIDAGNAARYHANAEKFAADTFRLDAGIKAMLAPAAGKGFILFHDAYQYLEQRYSLNALGAITLAPDVPPSARRIAQLQQRIKTQQAVCVFAEPQFSPQMVNTLVKGTTARIGTLNPDASDIAVSPALYGEYLRRLAGAISACLNP